MTVGHVNRSPHTQITHELLEALARTPLPGRDFRVMLALLRLLHGYHKTADHIGATQLSKATGIDAADVKRCLKDLVSWRLISRTGGSRGRGNRAQIEIQENPDQWCVAESAEALRRIEQRKKGGATTPNTEKGVTEEKGATLAVKGGDIAEKRGGRHPHSKDSPKITKDSVGPTSSDPPFPPQDVRRLANFIADLGGEPDEKLAWVMSGEGLKILGEAEAALPDDATARQRSGKLQSFTIRYYERYLKGRRPFKDWAKRQAAEAKADAWEAEHGAELRALEQLEEEDQRAAAHL